MKYFLRLLLLAALALGATALPLWSQGQKQPRPAPEEPSPYHPPAAWKSVEIGNYYLKRKNYPGALSRYQEAVQTDPHYPGGYLGMGKVYDKLGFKEKALEAYRQYLDLLPSTKDALEAKDVQKAIARLERELAKTAKPTRQKTGAR
jgi:tetratricopeptide (TPR) repeat protein